MKDEYGRDVPSFEDIFNNTIRDLENFPHVNCRCIPSLHNIISLYEELKTNINYFIYN